MRRRETWGDQNEEGVVFIASWKTINTSPCIFIKSSHIFPAVLSLVVVAATNHLLDIRP